MSNDRIYAPEDLKRTQEVLLDILKDVLRVCNENDITIFAEGGTAIGAVRHGGFIPWDDDIDLWVLRDDYEKLLTILPEQLDPRFGTDHWMSNKDFPAPNLCVYAKGSLSVPVEMKNCKYQYGISLGIFPYDNISDDEQKADIQMKCGWILGKINWLKLMPFPYIPHKGMKRFLIHSICGLGHIFLKLIPRKLIITTCEKNCRMFNDSETSKMTIIMAQNPRRTVIEKHKIFPAVAFDFDGLSVNLPACYDELLTREYGDYMQIPPKDKQKNHFPCILKFPDEEETS